MKKLIGAAMGVGLLLATVVPTFAAECTLTNTGPFSDKNTCKVRNNKTVNYAQFNNAKVTKTQVGVSNSGLNSQLLNTNVSGGGITSDDAESKMKSLTDVNSTDLAVDQSAGGTSNGTITNTGPFSSNTVKITANKTADIAVFNNANVTETLVSVANSGGNSTSLNTNASGEIKAGEAESRVTSETYVNYTKVNITQ